MEREERMPKIHPVEFSLIKEEEVTPSPIDASFLNDVPIEITVEVGRTKKSLREILKLKEGSIIELSQMEGEAFNVFANKKLIAKGNVVVVNDNLGIRITELVDE